MGCEHTPTTNEKTHQINEGWLIKAIKYFRQQHTHLCGINGRQNNIHAFNETADERWYKRLPPTQHSRQPLRAYCADFQHCRLSPAVFACCACTGGVLAGVFSIVLQRANNKKLSYHRIN